MKSSEETSVLFPCKADHAQFRDHDRPTENGYDSQKSENDFARDCRVIERKQQTAAGRYDFRNEHSLVTGISNNAVLRKCYLSFRDRDAALRRPDSAARCPYLAFLGNVGCLFAATINAAPITMRKNEKNWPRVKGPISSASGSRKFSTTIRKIA